MGVSRLTGRSARREDAIAKALQKKLEQRRAMREANAEAFRKEIEEFTANFLNAAREAFALIDKDDSGSLSKTEIVRAVREDRPVIDFLRNCGEENLQFLLQPARLEKALDQLDTDNSGEVDVDECTGAASCVYVRCLLYTSPSPRDGLLSRMPSSA